MADEICQEVGAATRAIEFLNHRLPQFPGVFVHEAGQPAILENAKGIFTGEGPFTQSPVPFRSQVTPERPSSRRPSSMAQTATVIVVVLGVVQPGVGGAGGAASGRQVFRIELAVVQHRVVSDAVVGDAVAGRIFIEADADAGRVVGHVVGDGVAGRAIQVDVGAVVREVVIFQRAGRLGPGQSRRRPRGHVPGVRPDDVVSGATVNGVIAVAVVHIRTGVVTQDYRVEAVCLFDAETSTILARFLEYLERFEVVLAIQ